MITVYYWPREFRMTVEGHASARQMDKNPLVCAAASILLYGLENCIDGFKWAKWVKDGYYHEKSGRGYVKCTPKWHKRKLVRVAYGFAYGAMGMLQKHYPEALKCEVMTGVVFDDEKEREGMPSHS